MISIRGGSSNTEQIKSTLLCSAQLSRKASSRFTGVLYEKLRGCNDAYMPKQLNSALDILSDALRLYGAEQIFASYNGGKDAVVVLHLLRAVAAKHTAESGVSC